MPEEQKLDQADINQINPVEPVENLPEKSSSSKRMKVILFFGLFFFLLLISGGVIAYLSMRSNIESSESSTLIVSPTISQNVTLAVSSAALLADNSLEPPPLYPEAEWEEFEESEIYRSLGTNGLYSFSEGFKSGSIEITGEEWATSITSGNMVEVRSYIDSISEYYKNELGKSGWKGNYKDEVYDFDPINADGPMGSIYGYIKVIDGNLRVILFQESYPPVPHGETAVCPCEGKLTVFIGDPEPMSELVKRIK